MSRCPRHVTLFAILVVALAGCSLLVGCSSSSVVVAAKPRHPGGFTAVPVPQTFSAEASAAPPGIREMPAGRTQAIGTLEYGSVGMSGPGWVLVARYPWTDAKTQRLLARVTGLDDSLAYASRGTYVVVDGVMRGGVLDAGGMLRIGGDHVDPMPLVTYATARMEKPNQTYLSGGRLRVVGQLAYLGGFRDVHTERWAVMSTFPGGWPGAGAARVGAFLETTPSAAFDTSGYPYVAVAGKVVGSVKVSGTRWPIIRPETVSLVATCPPW